MAESGCEGLPLEVCEHGLAAYGELSVPILRRILDVAEEHGWDCLVPAVARAMGAAVCVSDEDGARAWTEEWMPTEDSERTPMQALYHAAHATGWCRNKQDFARLLRINAGNIYGYLADPSPRPGVPEDGVLGRNKSWIKAQTGLLHGFCWALSRTTELEARACLESDGTLEIHIHGRTAQGDDASSVLPPRGIYRTVYDVYDGFRPPNGWESEWESEWERDPPEAP